MPIPNAHHSLLPTLDTYPIDTYPVTLSPTVLWCQTSVSAEPVHSPSPTAVLSSAAMMDSVSEVSVNDNVSEVQHHVYVSQRFTMPCPVLSVG